MPATHIPTYLLRYLDFLHIDWDALQQKTPLEQLNLLMHRHVLTVFHDTLSMKYHLDTSVNPQFLMERFMAERRGGICFELNIVMNHLLQQLGFASELRSSQVLEYQGEKLNYPIDTHCVIVVNLLDASSSYQQYLVDVGFGDLFLYPLPIIFDRVFHDNSGYYKLQQSTDFTDKRWFLQVLYKGNFYTLYDIKPKKALAEDFTHQLNLARTPNEHAFSNKMVCTYIDSEGVRTLSENKLTIRHYHDNQVTEEPVGDLFEVLHTLFNMDANFIARIQRLHNTNHTVSLFSKSNRSNIMARHESLSVTPIRSHL